MAEKQNTGNGACSTPSQKADRLLSEAASYELQAHALAQTDPQRASDCAQFAKDYFSSAIAWEQPCPQDAITKSLINHIQNSPPPAKLRSAINEAIERSRR